MNELKALLLRPPGRTLAVAESLTAGHLQAGIGATAGASAYFLGGLTAYSLEQKVKLLGVDRAVARPVNCVSADVAEQMARGACELFGADLGVATTGYAEPSRADGVAVPFAWWAVAARGRVHGGKGFKLWHGRVECPGEPRVEVQRMVAAVALAELTELLRMLRG